MPKIGVEADTSSSWAQTRSAGLMPRRWQAECREAVRIPSRTRDDIAEWTHDERMSMDFESSLIAFHVLEA